jgi:hypothetical protein
MCPTALYWCWPSSGMHSCASKGFASCALLCLASWTSCRPWRSPSSMARWSPSGERWSPSGVEWPPSGERWSPAAMRWSHCRGQWSWSCACCVQWTSVPLGVGMCATKLQWVQLRLLSYSGCNLAFQRLVEYTGGIEGPGRCPSGPREQKKRERNSQWHVAPPDTPPYREVTSGRKQELDQEATPGRRNFFHRSIRSKPKL